MNKIVRHQSEAPLLTSSASESSRRCCGQSSHNGERSQSTDIQSLIQASDLEALLLAFARSASNLTDAGQPFVLFKDRQTGEFNASFAPAADKTSSILPLRIEFHLEGDPALFETLTRGEHVVMHRDGNSAWRRESVDSSKQSCLFLFPLIYESDLVAVLCVSVSAEERQPSSQDLESLHLLCQQVAPMIARMCELEALRMKSAELDHLAEKVAGLEQTLGELMHAKRELEAVDHQMKSHLLTNVSHELRTPLVAIRGYTKMILEGRTGSINNTQREYLTIVSENINRLVSMTGNLVRLTASQQLRLESFDLRDLWRESLSWSKPHAHKKSIRITGKIPSEPFVIVGDKGKLTQVFNDLLFNALKYTNSGGEIIVEFARGQYDEVTVRVSDTGAGIPQELLNKIFDNYSQPNTPAGIEQPPGMGLSFVHDIIYLHGGRISVASKVGEGSTFFFTLPALKAISRKGEFRL